MNTYQKVLDIEAARGLMPRLETALAHSTFPEYLKAPSRALLECFRNYLNGKNRDEANIVSPGFFAKQAERVLAKANACRTEKRRKELEEKKNLKKAKEALVALRRVLLKKTLPEKEQRRAEAYAIMFQGYINGRKSSERPMQTEDLVCEPQEFLFVAQEFLTGYVASSSTLMTDKAAA